MIDKGLNNIEISCLKCVQREAERDEALSDNKILLQETARIGRERDEMINAARQLLRRFVPLAQQDGWLALYPLIQEMENAG